jgi:hypothetical protein
MKAGHENSYWMMRFIFEPKSLSVDYLWVVMVGVLKSPYGFFLALPKNNFFRQELSLKPKKKCLTTLCVPQKVLRPLSLPLFSLCGGSSTNNKRFGINFHLPQFEDNPNRFLSGENLKPAQHLSEFHSTNQGTLSHSMVPTRSTRMEK